MCGVAGVECKIVNSDFLWITLSLNIRFDSVTRLRGRLKQQSQASAPDFRIKFPAAIFHTLINVGFGLNQK